MLSALQDYAALVRRQAPAPSDITDAPACLWGCGIVEKLRGRGISGEAPPGGRHRLYAMHR